MTTNETAPLPCSRRWTSAPGRSRADITVAAGGVEFLDFINRVVKEYAGKGIHVILDNLSTHKPKRDMWLTRRPAVHFHYMPTHASWLNQIEIWISILASQSLQGSSFRSAGALVMDIESFIAHYNEDAHPFSWTKSVVHQKRLKPCFAVQRFRLLACADGGSVP
jgi:transposase